MNMLIKRRQLIMATLVVALGAAVFVNWYFTKSPGELSDASTTDAGYVQNIGEAQYVNAGKSASDALNLAKLNRQKAHDEALEKMQDILEKLPVSSASADEVAKDIDALTALITKEADLEALITAKLGGECVVILSEDAVQVVAPKSILSDDSTIKIISVITENTKLTADNIKITEAK